MGTIAARQAREILNNVVNVLAIELLAAAQGIDFLEPLAPGRGTAAAQQAIREIIPHLDKDRFLSPEIRKLHDLIADGTLVQRVESVTGTLAF